MKPMSDLLKNIVTSLSNGFDLITLETIVPNVFFSILAALIFWIIFNYFPEKQRKTKLRPKVEFDIYEFFQELFSFMQIPLKYNLHSPCLFQNDINAGKISKSTFETWLQNKCLNDSYLFDEMADKYLCIGDSLDVISLNLCEKSKNIYMFTDFLTAKEILLIKKITTKLRVYSYTGSCETVIANKIFKPHNPNMVYMAENFFEIYKLFIELQKLVLKYKYIDTSINVHIAGDLKWRDITNCYYRGEYRKCIFQLNLAKLLNKFPEDLWYIKFMSLYQLGKCKQALTYLEKQLFTHKLKLISIRNCFDQFYADEDVKSVLIKSRGESEYSEMIECITQEKSILDFIVEQSELIRKFYLNKPHKMFNED